MIQAWRARKIFFSGLSPWLRVIVVGVVGSACEFGGGASDVTQGLIYPSDVRDTVRVSRRLKNSIVTRASGPCLSR
jgi:hypothetical protein